VDLGTTEGNLFSFHQSSKVAAGLVVFCVQAGRSRLCLSRCENIVQVDSGYVRGGEPVISGNRISILDEVAR